MPRALHSTPANGCSSILIAQLCGKCWETFSCYILIFVTLSKGWNIKSYMHSCGIQKSRQRTTSHIRGYIFQPKTLGEEMVHYDIQSEFRLTGFWPLSICLFRVTNSSALHCTFNVDPLYLQHENSGDAVDYMVNMWYLWFFNFITMDVRFELSMFKGLTLSALNFVCLFTLCHISCISTFSYWVVYSFSKMRPFLSLLHVIKSMST